MLGKLLVSPANLLLLDEPTNHLDIEAITWLEEFMAAFSGALLFISHDRAFLRALSRATLWIDRGAVRRQEKGFEAFEGWRDAIWEEEDTQRHKLNRKIKAVPRWAVKGIAARRDAFAGLAGQFLAHLQVNQAQVVLDLPPQVVHEIGRAVQQECRDR